MKLSPDIHSVHRWYEDSYRKQGFGAQRLYPNEEFLRFLGRRFFPLSPSERRRSRILEVGCGSCSNLWVLAKEGFDAYGIDISKNAIELGQRVLERWGGDAHLNVGSMTSLAYPPEHFDAVCDIFSSVHLTHQDFLIFLGETYRVLKPGGIFFMYTPSAESDAFKRHAPAKMIDQFTLSGIYRKSSPFYGNFYPWRFADVHKLQIDLRRKGFGIDYVEKLTKSYRKMKENFQFLSVEAVRKTKGLK
jgi:SAM-dependent methyltransferase